MAKSSESGNIPHPACWDSEGTMSLMPVTAPGEAKKSVPEILAVIAPNGNGQKNVFLSRRGRKGRTIGTLNPNGSMSPLCEDVRGPFCIAPDGSAFAYAANGTCYVRSLAPDGRDFTADNIIIPDAKGIRVSCVAQCEALRYVVGGSLKTPNGQRVPFLLMTRKGWNDPQAYQLESLYQRFTGESLQGTYGIKTVSQLSLSGSGEIVAVLN